MRSLLLGVPVPLLLVAFVFAGTPVQAQDSSTFETLDVTLQPTNFTIALKRTLVEGTKAADERYYMDAQFGNGDDIVERSEVNAYAADWRDATNAQLVQFETLLKPWSQIQVDGRPAERVRVTAVTITGAEGFVDDDKPYSVDFHAYMSFPPVHKERVQVRFGQEFVLPKLYYNTANLSAGSPWRIDPDPERKEFWEKDHYHFAFEQVEDFSSRSNHHFFNLTTEPPADGGKKRRDSPAGALPLALAGVALAAVVAARRHR